MAEMQKDNTGRRFQTADGKPPVGSGTPVKTEDGRPATWSGGLVHVPQE